MIRSLKKRSEDFLDRSARKATWWVGSTNSLLIHTALFFFAFLLYFWGIEIDKILLVVTTIVSLEAIYLSIFIQMSVNRQTRRLREVSRDIEEIQEDVEEIQEDVEGIEKDVDEIQKDVDEIQEDVDDLSEESEKEITIENHDIMLARIEQTLGTLMKEISDLKKK